MKEKEVEMMIMEVELNNHMKRRREFGGMVTVAKKLHHSMY